MSRVANFAHVIKSLSTLTKTQPLKIQKKLKELEILC